MRAGQALRGSSEFHAWGDSNLYLRRHGDQLTLSVEHRAAAAISAVSLRLATAGDAVALTAIDRETSAAPPLIAAPAAITIADRVEQHLAASTAPLTATAIRKLCQIRNATLLTTLATLAAGRIRKDRAGYVIAS
jgi:hypothetical protein